MGCYKHLFYLVSLIAPLCFTPGGAAGSAIVNWIGADPAHSSWSIANNWSNPIGPGAADIASFGNTGAAALPGQATNSLAGNRTVAGLTYNNTNGYYHTTDLGGHELTITGDLNFNVNRNSPTTTTIRNGVLTVTNPLANINVGRSYSGGSWANVDLSGASLLRSDINQLHVGTRISGSVYGELTLAAENDITANEIVVGNGGTGKMHLVGD